MPSVSIGVELTDVQLAVLDRYRAETMSREEALSHAFTEWGVSKGLVDDPVEDNSVEISKLNSANDI